jgi:hypothetical protein
VFTDAPFCRLMIHESPAARIWETVFPSSDNFSDNPFSSSRRISAIFFANHHGSALRNLSQQPPENCAGPALRGIATGIPSGITSNGGEQPATIPGREKHGASRKS